MYLKTHLYLDLTSDNYDNNDYDLLKRTLRKNNVYNRKEKEFLNIKDTQSFDSMLEHMVYSHSSFIRRQILRSKKKENKIKTIIRI